MTEFDRAAPQGTGSVKAGGNYAADLLPLKRAKSEGYGTTLYLDAVEHRHAPTPHTRDPGRAAAPPQLHEQRDNFTQTLTLYLAPHIDAVGRRRALTPLLAPHSLHSPLSTLHSPGAR